MTISIGAIGAGRIAFITDQKASLDNITIDHVMAKADFCSSPYWVAVWDGLPHIAHDVMIATRKRLADCSRPEDYTRARVTGAVAEAVRAERLQRAAIEVLGVYGLDMPTFLATGSETFAEEHGRILERLESYDLGTSFLVCGFERASPVLAWVDPKGQIYDQTRLGFWAIGNGFFAAQNTMSVLEHNSTKPLPDTVYAVCAAKFAAERCDGVGRWTTLGVIDPVHGPCILTNDDADLVRVEWERQARIPQSAADVIRRSLPEKWRK
jgi:20S proteasome alpha/beta subunit